MMISKGYFDFRDKLEKYLRKSPDAPPFESHLIKDIPGETVGILELYPDDREANVKIRLDALYEMYSKGEPLSFIASRIMDLKRERYAFRRKELGEAYVRLYGEFTDRELLRRLPHERIGDMYLICHIRRDARDLAFKPETITYEMLREIGMSRSELFKIVLETCKEKYPAEWHPLSDIIYPEDGSVLKDGMNQSDRLLYISDEKGITGAAAALYDGVLDRIRRKLGEDLILIPSSIYEMIILPKSAADPADLERILRKNNHSAELMRESVLSDHLYTYDGRSKELQMLKGYALQIPVGSSRLEAALHLWKTHLKKENGDPWGRRRNGRI